MKAQCMAVLGAILAATTIEARGKEETATMTPLPDIELTLPPVIYATPGLETNLYFANTVLMINPDNVVFDVDCPKGRQEQERWTYTPKKGEAGDYPLSLTVLDAGNRSLAHATCIVRVIESSAPRSFSVLIIGDSLTHASVYPARILENAKNDPALDLHLIGTHAPRKDLPDVRHEGYGGWTAAAFVSRYDKETWKDGRRACSPFVFTNEKGTPALDFPRYCREQNGGRAPDLVTILLGCNDIFGADENRQAQAIETSLANIETLVSAIKSYSPKTRVGILLLAPPAASQDAFGANYGCGQTRWQYRRNQHRMVQRTIEAYGNKEKEGIYLLPTDVILDTVNGFPRRTTKANAHSEREVSRLCNGVHPNADGYQQIGDTVYAWIKAVARENN